MLRLEAARIYFVIMEIIVNWFVFLRFCENWN